jgi:hypothetical protein
MSILDFLDFSNKRAIVDLNKLEEEIAKADAEACKASSEINSKDRDFVRDIIKQKDKSLSDFRDYVVKTDAKYFNWFIIFFCCFFAFLIYGFETNPHSSLRANIAYISIFEAFILIYISVWFTFLKSSINRDRFETTNNEYHRKKHSSIPWVMDLSKEACRVFNIPYMNGSLDGFMFFSVRTSAALAIFAPAGLILIKFFG